MLLSDDESILLKISGTEIQNATFTIPSSVTHIGDDAFKNCHRLRKVIIPNSVTHIGSGAFVSCSNLATVTITNSVTHIGSFAFAYCTGLTEVTIPDSVTHIGVEAFKHCYNLSKVIIPNSVTHIREAAFELCRNLTEVTIPNSVTHIDDYAFMDCKSLTKVTIPNSVTYIGERAFYECGGLTEVTIPNSVTHIGAEAFHKCNNLGVIIIDALNTEAYERISVLIPQEFRHLIIPNERWCEIKKAREKAREQALGLIKAIGVDSFPPKLFALVNLIQQYEGSLHNVLHQVPLPQHQEKPEVYKKALHEALNQFRQEQEPFHQKLVAINKLQQVIQKTSEALKTAASKNTSFFNSPENLLKLSESQERINFVTKLINWLGGNKTISFTEYEIRTLSESRNSAALILKNCEINPSNLPKTPTIKLRLDKYKIADSKKYLDAFGKLINLQYNEQQANQLILGRCSENTIHSVLENHSVLMGNFNREQIIKIAGHDGGSDNIAVVIKQFDRLQSFGFSQEQIVEIAGHDGGSDNIAVVIERLDGLQSFEFSLEHIVKIAGHRGGANNITAATDWFGELIILGFSQEQIVEIAGHDGGSSNIGTVIEYFKTLQPLGFSQAHIVEIAGRAGGSNTIFHLFQLSHLISNPPEVIEAFKSNIDAIIYGLSRRAGCCLLEKSLSHYSVLSGQSIIHILFLPQKIHQILNEIISDIKTGAFILDQNSGTLKQKIFFELKQRIFADKKDLNNDDWRTFCELFNVHQKDATQERKVFPSILETILEECFDEFGHELDKIICANESQQNSNSSLLQKENLFSGQKHSLDTDHYLDGDIGQSPKKKN